MSNFPIPRSLADLEEPLGREAIMRLLLAYPGMDITVPESVNADHHLARSIGLRAAAKLAQHAAGTRLYIPSTHARAVRDEAICNARRAGDGIHEIALRHGLSARYVERILARGRG